MKHSILGDLRLPLILLGCLLLTGCGIDPRVFEPKTMTLNTYLNQNFMQSPIGAAKFLKTRQFLCNELDDKKDASSRRFGSPLTCYRYEARGKSRLITNISVEPSAYGHVYQTAYASAPRVRQTRSKPKRSRKNETKIQKPKPKIVKPQISLAAFEIFNVAIHMGFIIETPDTYPEFVDWGSTRSGVHNLPAAVTDLKDTVGVKKFWELPAGRNLGNVRTMEFDSYAEAFSVWRQLKQLAPQVDAYKFPYGSGIRPGTWNSNSAANTFARQFFGWDVRVKEMRPIVGKRLIPGWNRPLPIKVYGLPRPR